MFAHAATATLFMLCAMAAPAQNYPVKPIRLLVGFTAGGSADASARSIATRMSEALGATIVVENRGGAGGSIAAQIVARAPADGYTLLWSSPGALTISQIIEKNLPYNAATAFAPIGLAVTFCNALVVRNDSALTSVEQLVALAKEMPGQLRYATQGVGSAGHLSGEMLQAMTGAVLTHVPYKGGSDILTAVLGGELELGLMSSTTAGTMRSRIRILAVTSRNRDPSLPDVPSMHEAGVRNYDATFWFGLLAPAGTPSTVIDRLNQLMRATLNDPEVARSSRSQGLNPAPSTPQEFAALIKADYARWKKVIGDK
ncbi:MAG TPA: tripartite tricarboxylate transporter substrate binding protein [Burkholderiales bacterium]|nr:tripartite tricarboxylate transporter substrate binding protein [Burkholderiales bacterium]